MTLKKPRRRFMHLPVIGVSALFLAACGGGDETSAPAAGSTTADEGDSAYSGTVSIRLNWIPGGQHAFLYYGVQEGYFSDEGVELEILEGKGSQLAIDDVAAGNADIAMAGTGPAILGIGQGREIISVGMPIGAGTYGFFVDEGVGAEGVEDLVGQEVLITPGSPETPLIPAVLGVAGINEADVNLVNVEAASKLSAYVGGAGNAMATTIPFYNAHVQSTRPSDTFLFSDFGLVLPDYSFLARTETLESEPAMIAAFLRASLKSLDAAIEDPEAAVQALEDARPDEVEYELELQSWNDFLPFICSDEQEGDLLGRHAESDWQQAVSLLQEHSGLDSGIEPTDLYTNQFFDDEGSAVTEATCR